MSGMLAGIYTREIVVSVLFLRTVLALAWETLQLPIEILSGAEYTACLQLLSRGYAWLLQPRSNVTKDCASGAVAHAVAAEIATTVFHHAQTMSASGQLIGEQGLELLALAQDLAGFSIHIGFRSHEDTMMWIYGVVERTRTSILGGRQKWLLLADMSPVLTSVAVAEAIKQTDAYFLSHGFQIQKMSHWDAPAGGAAWLAHHARGAEVKPQGYLAAGCHVNNVTRLKDFTDTFAFDLCDCLVIGQPLATSWGLPDSDIELFVRLRATLPASPRVFVIGNAFGYSSVLLASLLESVSVDVIDAEVEGPCNVAGSWLTRRVAEASALDLHLSSGFSPRDVPKAMRFSSYDLIFIDGMHTNDQLRLDFAAIEPHLTDSSLVVLHDVGFHDLHAGVAALPRTWKRHLVRGQSSRNILGTVLLHRNLSPTILRTI